MNFSGSRLTARFACGPLSHDRSRGHLARVVKDPASECILMKAKLDLHIHSEQSPDGRMTINEIINRAKEKGLQGVAICDHDCFFDGQMETDGFLLIGGEEFSTPYGHLLGLFLTELIPRPDFSGGTDEKRLAFETLTQAIRAQGGLAVLAHPFEHAKTADRFEAIVPYLDGMEIWNGRANRKNQNANRQAEEFARSRNLPGFGGSDAHIIDEIGNGYVTVEVETLTLQNVKEALLRAGNPVSGVNGKSLYVAASQFTRRRKTGARPRSYMKWAAFAVKCCAEDVLRTIIKRRVE